MMSAPSDRQSLPSWNLGDLYPTRDGPEIQADLAAMETAAGNFAHRYQGHTGALSGEELAKAVAEYERIDETLSRLMSYASLTWSGAMNDPMIGRFHQGIREAVNAISTRMIFFTLELNRIDDAALVDKMRSPTLARYRPWLDAVRAMRPHQLADDVERLLHEKEVVGCSAWCRLFDETIASLRFSVDTEVLTISDALNLLSGPDAAKRKAAAMSVGEGLQRHLPTFALITNTLARDKAIEDRWRGFPRPVSQRNLSNQVEDEVVDALTTSVRSAFPSLAHRYYRLKARWLGGETLAWWDRNAPLPNDDDSFIGWDEAQALVLDAWGRFSGEMASLGQRFFDNPWIDAAPRPGKAPGAFAHPTVPSAHPYLLLNYHGRTRDVMTLAHELGHGVHQILAARQGHLLANTPLTLAETASVFGEMLTFQALLARQTDHQRRKSLLAGKVEDMLNTVVRQIAFYGFEEKIHQRRQEGEITPQEIGQIWMDIQKESLGPSLELDDTYQSFWAYIPHFIHSPFYVYAYAFGDCLVNSLYTLHEEGAEDFPRRYLEMLAAGGTRRHRDLLAPFGLDASDPAFWNRGLGLIGRYLDQLEAME